MDTRVPIIKRSSIALVLEVMALVGGIIGVALLTFPLEVQS